eukprot:CAMPEP_0178438226 /NCGR_PEP_ID=MMETSP0689_2-20121128/35472_1 /TAXON_ID=160604 /ORGANISM="Amphidinium massartii, Strain CS-259" /LENGTH=1024 /DNA_ID=CAMNT_0020060599 /DNA_START=142 /DNA_END=3216 /DNA_ORIENTATION=-
MTVDTQLFKAGGGRVLGVRESNQALAELKTKLEFALSRLNDQDTLRTGLEEIREFLQALYADWFPMVISCISEAAEKLKPLGRCESVKLMGMLAEIHGEAVVPLLPRILQVVVTSSRDADLHLREACAETVFRLTQALVVGPESSTTFATLLKPLFGALGEHNKWVQIGAAACICSVIQGAPSLVIKDNLGRLCSRLVQHLNLPLAMAKPQLLNACIYLMQAVEGAEFDEALPALMPCLESCLNAAADWQTRREAIEVLQVIGDNVDLGQSLDLSPVTAPGTRPTQLQKRIAQILEPAKVDKVRAVREAVKDALLGWGISKPAPAVLSAAATRSSSPTGSAAAAWPDREALFRSVPSVTSVRSHSPLHGDRAGDNGSRMPEVATPTGGNAGLRQRSVKAERESADGGGMGKDISDGAAADKAARGAAVKAALSGAMLNSTKKARPKKERQSIFNGPANANFFRQGAGGEGGDDAFDDGIDEDGDVMYDHDGSSVKTGERASPSSKSTGRLHSIHSEGLGEESPSIPVGDGFDVASADTSGTMQRGEDEPSPAAAAREASESQDYRRDAGRIAGTADARRARGTPLRQPALRAHSEDGRTVPGLEETSQGQTLAARSRRQPDVPRQRQDASPDVSANDREWQWDQRAGSGARGGNGKADGVVTVELLEIRKQMVMLFEERQVAEKRLQDRVQAMEATCERQADALGDQQRRLDAQGKQLQIAEVQLRAQEQLLQQQDARMRKQDQLLQEYEAQIHQQQLLLEQHEQQLKEREQLLEKHEQKLEQHSKALDAAASQQATPSLADLRTEEPGQVSDQRQQRFAEAQTALAGTSLRSSQDHGAAGTPTLRHIPRSALQVVTDGQTSPASRGDGANQRFGAASLLQPLGQKASSGALLWESVVALCDERRYLEAYKQVIAEPEESCLLRLMQHTGPVVDKLDAESNSRLVRRLIHILSSPAKELLTANVEFIFTWLKQALDVGIHFTTSQVEDLAAALQKVAAASSPLSATERAEAQRLQLRVAALRRG